MSANIAVTPGSGASVAAESIGGALLQRIKMAIGDADADGGDVSLLNPMPVGGNVAPGVAVAGNPVRVVFMRLAASRPGRGAFRDR